MDDGSPDGTEKVIRKLMTLDKRIKLVCREGKKGLGTAYEAGFEVSEGDFVVLMDADLSHHV